MINAIKQNPGKTAGVSLAALALVTPLLMQLEGKRNDPYNDIVGVRTVCYGETAGIMERRYSDAECKAMLDKSILKHAEPVLKCVPQLKDNAYFQAASISFAYNIGTSAYCKSSVADAFRRGDNAVACRNFYNFLKPAKIKRRRARERALCEKGLS